MQYIGKVTGFAQRTFTEVQQTPFYPQTYTGKWRSPVTQKLIEQDLMEFRNTSPEPKTSSYKLACSYAFNAFHLPDRVKMIHLNDIFNQPLDIWNKSPGLPWRDQGYKTKGDIKKDPDAIRRIRYYWHRVKGGYDIHPPDCLAYVRSHVCNIGERKVRAVWGYSATLTFAEAQFVLPLLEAYKFRSSPIAFGYETAVGGMRKICHKFNIYQNFTGIDFKKFDKTVPTWLILKAFDILRCNIDFLNYQEHGVADVRRNIHLYEYLVDYFINTTIRTANGKRFKKNSGIASGSYFTQLIGSICNYILIQWASIELNGMPVRDIIVLGDDSLFASYIPTKLQDFQNFFKLIQMEINVEKSQVTTELETMKFLGYRIGNGTPKKEHSEWMTALLFPESPDYSFDQLQSRALGLYYANMCVDATFAAICRGLVKMRPFDLILARNFERHLKFIGISLEYLKTSELPTAYEFARLMI